MRLLVKIAAITALLVSQLLLTSLAGSAQVDPCTPVPIPGLCQSPLPSPTPLPTGSGGPGPGGGGDGSTGGEPSSGGPGDAGGTGGTTGTEAATGTSTGGGPAGKGGGGNGGIVKQTKKDEGAQKEPAPVPPTQTGPFRISSPNNSSQLVQTLSQLIRYGVPLQEALLKTVGPFPIAGLSYWTDDWHACRDGCTRFHEGLDMFAKAGTPLVAIADGFVSQKLVGELSGISVEITDAQGVQYFYAHLSAWAEGLRVGQQVRIGQVLGYVGNTGNAIYTPSHLHLEVQPGGIPVPPKPFVDRWLEIAELRAEQFVVRYTGEEVPLAGASDFRLTRLFDLAGEGSTAGSVPERLLMLTGIQPGVSSVELARATLEEMAWEIYWGGQADAQLAELAEQYGQVSGEQDLAAATPWTPFGVPAVPAAGEVTGLVGSAEQGD